MQADGELDEADVGGSTPILKVGLKEENMISIRRYMLCLLLPSN